jgi:hypothetical protein
MGFLLLAIPTPPAAFSFPMAQAINYFRKPLAFKDFLHQIRIGHASELCNTGKSIIESVPEIRWISQDSFKIQSPQHVVWPTKKDNLKNALFSCADLQYS